MAWVYPNAALGEFRNWFENIYLLDKYPAYLRGKTRRKNNHPCVKPIDLCRYFSTLLLPPKRETPRRILVPFSGSGSEVIGALLAGWDEVVGIEIDPDYVEMSRARISHWIATGLQEMLF